MAAPRIIIPNAIGVEGIGMERVAIINVGANASHGGLRSPIFPDGTFELLPIPEEGDLNGRSLVTFADLRSRHGRDLRPFIPPRLWHAAAHLDPEFTTMTYGDHLHRGRGGNLQRLRQGDLLFFLGRLVVWRDGGFTNAAGFYLLGFLEVSRLVPHLVAPPSPYEMRRWRLNAHVRRALADGGSWDGFCLVEGTPRSRLFRRAVPFPADLAEAVIAADGAPWRWGPRRTELQTIGSYTRACRLVEDRRAIGRLLGHIEAQGEPMNPWSAKV